MTDADFSGYVTKAGLKCSDGRTITPEAFKHQDTITVPLVWQHGHTSPDNVLGHTVLEAREDGVYGYGYFNKTKQGQTTKELVEHGDINMMSIYANQLVEKSKTVLHGMICEVSLVLKGANPGALIDYVRIAHSDDPDDVSILDDQAIIFTGLEIKHGDDESPEDDETDDENDETDEEARHVQEVFDSLDDEQKEVVHAMVGAALEHAAGDDDDDDLSIQEVYENMSDTEKKVVAYMVGTALESASSDSAAQSAVDGTQNANNEGDLAHQEGTDNMSRNVFEQNATNSGGPTLSHADVKGIFESAKQSGSFKEAFTEYALQHSITDIEILFPDAKTISNSPEIISRRMEWVAKVLDGTKHAPFAKIKTILADITADEARAKGYVKGNQKVEEVLTLLRRTTGPTTIYKKQALDRDDLLDITDIDVVLWLKAEMKLMIEEEVARAILVGDGRSAVSPDKVKDPMGSIDGVGIRSILNDDDLYAVKVDMAANVAPKDAVKGLVRARSKYRGSGKPTLFISDAFLTDIMLEEDKFGRALYETEAALRDKLRVSDIVTVDLFDEHQDLFAIMVSLADYTIGANRGGELTSFEDFDIDFNKHKYLQETRLSGGLTKPYSAVVVRRSVGTLATASAPSFDGATDTVTIPTVTGVYYTVNDEVVTGSFVITSPTEIEAAPAEGYYLAMNSTRSWTYTP